MRGNSHFTSQWAVGAARKWTGAMLVLSAVCLGAGARNEKEKPSPDKGKWVSISDHMISPKWKPGENGKTTAVAVDRTTGAVLVVLTTSGEMGCSTDKGHTWQLIENGQLSGRCETGYAIDVDPNKSGRVACFMLAGDGGYTLDAGKHWAPFTPLGVNWDYGAVDWGSASPTTMMAVLHDSGRIYLTKDAGKTWRFIATGTESRTGSAIGIGVVDAGTLLLHRQDQSGIERSADDGITWGKVSDLNPRSRVAVMFKNVMYWVGGEGLIVSKDQGKTWQVQGKPVDAIMGPYFGKDENQIVVVGHKGFFQTDNGGKSWTNVLPMVELEDQLDAKNPYGRGQIGLTWYDNFAWDPIGNVFYHSRLGEATRKYER